MMTALALPFDVEQPAWLWLVFLVPLLIPLSWRSLRSIDPSRRLWALGLRSALIVLLSLCLAGVRRVQRNNDLTVMFLLDRSDSVEQLLDDQEAFVRNACEDIPPDDRVGVIDFAHEANVEQLPLRGGYTVAPGRLAIMSRTDRTNIASALRLAMATFPHDTAKRVVLLSDGNDNLGDVLSEARRAKADGIPIDIAPLWYERSNEVYFDRLIAPTHAEPGEQITLRLSLYAEQAASGMISIFQGGQLVEIPADRARVHLQPGINTFFLKLPVHGAGAHTFEAVFRPDDPSMDATPINNTATAFTFVSGQSTALLISNDPAKDAALVEALQSENVRVDVQSTGQLGEFDLLRMINYSTIILSNVPAAAFTEEQQEEMVVYVRDMGSGLIMLGGDEAFGAGGWIGSPVEKIMPVSFEIKHKRVIPRGALVLIMHSCEIARGQYYGKEMAKKSVDTISSQDYIGVLAYSFSPGGVNWEIPFQEATNKPAVKARIDRMQIGDMPDFGTTLGLAYRELTVGKGKDAAQKHVIILSDGDAQPPPPSLLNDLAQAKITVSTIGIGWGAHVMEPTMVNVARVTGGKYYNARNPRQLPQIFVKESKVVKRPLIINEPFPPRVLHADSELLAGLNPSEGVPPLGGMVMTAVKENPNVVIPLVRATDDGEDPVLAHWQYELGKTVAFTSGYWPHWGADWTAWPKFARFWAQLVRWTMRQDTPANFDTTTKVEGDRGRIIIDALDKDAAYLNMLQLRAHVIGPDNKPMPVRFMQTGPGHYEAEVPIEQAGQFLGNVQVFDGEGKSLGAIRTGFSVPFSPEYRDLRPNESLLRQVADITGGRWIDVPVHEANIFSHDLPPSVSRQPAWMWVLGWLLLPAFLLDVAARRLAHWLAFSIAAEVVVLCVLLGGFDMRRSVAGVLEALLIAEAIGWAIRFRYIGPLFNWITHPVMALARAGERSATALEKLKSTREKVRDSLQTSDEARDRAWQESATPLPAQTARRRYDVGDKAAKEPAKDLRETLGGARAGEPSEREEKSAESVQDETASTTSRLLAAKRKKKTDDQ